MWCCGVSQTPRNYNKKRGNYSGDSIPRGCFCEHSSQKARELRREIMESMIFCVSRSMQL